MTGKTHLIAGLAVATGYAAATQPDHPFVIAGATVLGALLPDIDLQTSKIGRRLKPASVLIQHLVGHRTLFHAPIFYGLLYWFLCSQFPGQQVYFMAALLGIASHLLLDMLNPSGIPVLYPWKKRFRFAKIHTGGKIEKILGICLAAAFAVISLGNLLVTIIG